MLRAGCDDRLFFRTARQTSLDLGAAGYWASVNGARAPAAAGALLGFIAVGIGLQSAALLPLRLPGIITTYITGTWTQFVSGLVRISTGVPAIRKSSKTDFEERLMVQVGFLMVYFLAALLTGWVSRHVPIGGIAAAPLLIVAIYGVVRG